MPFGDVVTFHERGQWRNRVEGEDQEVGAFYLRDEAIEHGREMAIERQAEHIVRGIDGRIHERNSYGHDPWEILS